MDIQLAYCEILAHQMHTGCGDSQGLTREFFHIFVHRVAELLHLTCRSFLIGLLGSDRLHSKGTDESDTDTEVQGAESRRGTLLEIPCPSCGSSINDVNNCCDFCLKQQQKDSDGFHIFKGTRDSLLGLRRDETPMKDGDFAKLVKLSQEHQIPLDLVRDHWKDFQEFDLSTDNLLQKDEFARAVRHRCNIPESVPLPSELLNDQWFKVTKYNDQCVDFERFLLWSFGTELVEERIVPDPQERRLRSLARKHDILPTDIDHIKRIFDKFDVDGRGMLNESNFTQTIHHLVYPQKAEDIGQPSLRRLWMEANTRNESGITFDTFLDWYLRRWVMVHNNARA